MDFYSKVFLLKKDQDNTIGKYSLFFKNSGLDYAGQFSNPEVFYSAIINTKENIIIFDPKSFMSELDRVCEMLACLQEFSECSIILCNDLPEGFEPPFKYVKPNDKIKDKMVRISDCILKVIKEYRNNPNNFQCRFYSKLRSLLNDLGFNSSELGFNYICDCIYYIYRENKPSIKIVGDVYKHVAKMNGALDYRVERDIRHAINTAMNNCDHKKLLSDEKLRCFDSIMFGTTAKNLIYAIIGYIKYDTTFVA